MEKTKMIGYALASVICAALMIVLFVCNGCTGEQGQPMNLDPIVEAAAPVVVQLFVPEPWRTLTLIALGGLSGGVVGRKTGKK